MNLLHLSLGIALFVFLMAVNVIVALGAMALVDSIRIKLKKRKIEKIYSTWEEK